MGEHPYMDMKAVAGRIKAARIACGITQSQPAIDLGVEQTAISRWESGNRVLSWDYFWYAIQEYDVSAEWLLTGRESDEPTWAEYPESRTEQEKHEEDEDEDEEEYEFEDDDELDDAYREVAVAAKEIIDMTEDVHPTFKYSMMKQLMSCQFIREHVRVRRKHQKQIKDAMIADAKLKGKL